MKCSVCKCCTSTGGNVDTLYTKLPYRRPHDTIHSHIILMTRDFISTTMHNHVRHLTD